MKNIINLIMGYLKNLIDTQNSASSKIFLGLIFAAVTIVIVLLKVLWYKEMPMDVIYFVGGLTTGFLGLSSLDRLVGK